MKYFRSNLSKAISWLLIIALLNITVGCNYYRYKLEKLPTTTEKMERLNTSPNYLIIHQSDLAFHLSNVRIDQQNQSMSGTLVVLPPDHLKYKETKRTPGAPNRYRVNPTLKKIATPGVVNEVHLYVKNMALVENETLTIPFSSIVRLEVYDRDIGATILAAIGSYLAAGFLIVLIILLTKSSCPFVYVNNGDEYVFAGEIYSGAIFKSIERDDYLVLPQITSDRLDIRVANLLKEKQYINQLNLKQVRHPHGTTVLPDQEGNIHVVQNPLESERVTVQDIDITTLLQKQDSINFTFNNEGQQNYFNEVVLTFPKTNAKEGHLLLHAKNSLWGDYVFGEFTKFFGKSYNSWIDKQNKRKEPEMKNWKVEQGLAMQVFLETKNGWEVIGVIDLVGPLSYRDLVVPIDFANHSDSQVKIKLAAGFMMWDLDYVGMDYSSDIDIEVNDISLQNVVDQNGNDVSSLIASNDDKYLTQLKYGDNVTASVALSNHKKEFEYDYILHARGYYNHVREYENDTHYIELLTFKTPGRFSRFSKEKLDEMNLILQNVEISASSKNLESKN